VKRLRVQMTKEGSEGWYHVGVHSLSLAFRGVGQSSFIRKQKESQLPNFTFVAIESPDAMMSHDAMIGATDTLFGRSTSTSYDCEQVLSNRSCRCPVLSPVVGSSCTVFHSRRQV
jgi:hypothetical protein